MKIITISFGIVLTLLGIIYHNAAGMSGIWPLMPALFGVVITLLGLLQGKWAHQHALYGSLLLAFLSLVGSIGALFRLLRGSEGAGDLERSIIGLSCVVFIGLGLSLIKEFWRGWQAFGQFLGDWLARVVLTIFYFSILVPFGVGVRLFSDPLQIKTEGVGLWRVRQTGDQKLEETMRQY